MGQAQRLLGLDLLLCVLPVRVAEGRALRHHVARRGLAVHRGGADEHVLADPAPERLDVPVHVGGVEGDEVHDPVEPPPGQLGQGPGVGRVARHPEHRSGQLRVPVPPREDRDLEARFHREADARGRDVARPPV